MKATSNLLRIFLPAIVSLALLGGACGVAQAADQLYLSNSNGTTEIIASSSGAPAGSIPGFTKSGLMALTPDGKKLFIADSRVIRVVNVTSNVVAAELPLPPEGGTLIDMEVSSDNRLYVSQHWAGKVVSYDTQTCALVRNYSVYIYHHNGVPADIALSPDGRRLYVSHCVTGDHSLNNNRYNISVFDTQTGDLLVSKRLDTMIHAMALSPDGARLYLALRNNTIQPSYKVSRLRASDLSLKSTITVSTTWPQDMIVSPDGKVYVTENFGSLNGRVSVLNEGATSVLDTLDVGVSPGRLSISPDKKRLYLGTDTGVNVIRLSDDSVSTLATGYKVKDVKAVSRFDSYYVAPLTGLFGSVTPTPAGSGSGVRPAPAPTVTATVSPVVTNVPEPTETISGPSSAGSYPGAATEPPALLPTASGLEPGAPVVPTLSSDVTVTPAGNASAAPGAGGAGCCAAPVAVAGLLMIGGPLAAYVRNVGK